MMIWALQQRLVVVAAIVAAAVAWRAWDVQHQRALGETRLALKTEKAANAKREKATRARQSVDSIPDKRLRDPYFRD